MAKQKRKTCLTCDGEPVARGLCSTCRTASRRAIERGDTTEEELVKAGLLLPARPSGRKSTNGFDKHLEKLQQQ